MMERKFAYSDVSIGVSRICTDCGRCKNHDDSNLAEDVKLFPSQKNTWSSIVVPAPQIVFKETGSPEEELRRTEEILERLEHPDANQLTVGDLSGARKKQREKGLGWINKPFNIDGAASVGDLSVLEPCEKDLDELYRGPTVPQPSISPCQETEANRIRLAKEKQEEAMKIRELLFQEEQAKEIRRQARSKGLAV